ncbi:MAG: hypothetical protein MJ100_04580 [Ruminococcus sp.]|nr:hypothetical protein [Ruminococcus sp.]
MKKYFLLLFVIFSAIMNNIVAGNTDNVLFFHSVKDVLLLLCPLFILTAYIIHVSVLKKKGIISDTPETITDENENLS